MSTGTVDAVVMRPIRGREELDLFCRFSYVLNDELAADLDAGRRRPEWLWIALRDDRLLARAAWWGRADDSTPAYLDVFDIDDLDPPVDSADIGRRLLDVARADVVRGGGPQPEYIRFVPPDWRDRPSTARVVTDRMAILEQTGAHLLVERLHFERRPGTPIAEPGGRLTFRPFRDTEEVLDLTAEVLEGTLDAHSQVDLLEMPARAAAVRHFEEELDRYETPRAWWRVAVAAGGEPVGFVIPARNAYRPIIAYIGVLPRHRGHGYIDEILAEGTRILAAEDTEDTEAIRASTDVGNVPMAQAFSRGGWINFERSINMTWTP